MCVCVWVFPAKNHQSQPFFFLFFEFFFVRLLTVVFSFVFEISCCFFLFSIEKAVCIPQVAFLYRNCPSPPPPNSSANAYCVYMSVCVWTMWVSNSGNGCSRSNSNKEKTSTKPDRKSRENKKKKAFFLVFTMKLNLIIFFNWFDFKKQKNLFCSIFHHEIDVFN